MNVKITASSLFLCLIFFTTHAQKGETCSRDYSLLSYTIDTELGNLQVDQEIYLSNAYLEALASGKYDQSPAETKYFEYLRPASKKEMKQGIEEGEKYELVFGDGNVYGLNFLPSHFHFFTPRPGFEGPLAGTWEDPYLILPLGLDPVNSKNLSGIKLKVLENNSDYVLLEGNSSTYIFYPGYPDVSHVFVRAESVDQIDSRTEMSETFIGQRFFLENHASLRYRQRADGPDKHLDPDNPGMEVRVSDVLSYAEEVLLYCGDNKIYVVLDDYASFKMFDLDCLEAENEVRWSSYEDEFSTSNQELNDLISASSGEEIIDIFENDWVIDLLKGRFRLHQDISAEKAAYECLYLKDDESFLKSFLSAHVNIDGEAYLQSHYSSERGLYHTRVHLFINGEEIISDRIRALDPRSIRYRKGNRVIEEIHFQGGADNGMMEQIARNSSEEITIRFSAGGSYYEDIILLPKYKDAIRDSWLLSQLIINEEDLNARIRGDK